MNTKLGIENCSVCERLIAEDEIVSEENIAKIHGAVKGKRYVPFILKKTGQRGEDGSVELTSICQHCWPEAITVKYLSELK